MFELKDKCNTIPDKGDMFLNNSTPDEVDVRPVIWQRNEGILRQALLNCEKDMKPQDKVLPAVLDSTVPEKNKSSELVEAINLYPPGSEGCEYSAHLLSQLTSTTLPTISSSQVSSVLSELEPTTTQQVVVCEANDGSITKTDKMKELNSTSSPKSIMEKQLTDKKAWYKCSKCSYICIDEDRATIHNSKCLGEVNKLSCMACDNTFKSTAILRAHLIVDHGASPMEHIELFAINLGVDVDSLTQVEDKADSLSTISGLSLFDTADKYIIDTTLDSGLDRPGQNNQLRRERKTVVKKVKKIIKKKMANVKTENGRPARCGIDGCGIRLKTPSNLEYHRQSHHESGWKCIECGSDSQSWASLTLHLWRQHGIDMDLFSCDQCSYKTNSLSKLMNLHRRTHGEERPFLCDICGKGFKTTKQLRNHKTVHKAKEKSERNEDLTCEVCSRKFNCHRMLRHHVDFVHRKLRPYLCSECGHAAASRSSLRMHCRQHTGEKPYACDDCDYRTSDHNTFRRHKMRHSGTKHYVCPHCPYASIQSSTFKAHLKSKHPGLDEGLLFSCEVCPFKTVKKENFLAHTSYHSLKSSDNELSKDADLDDYNLRSLVKEVSSSILPCTEQNFLGENVCETLKAEDILSRQRDPLLGDTRQPEDILGESDP